MDSRSQETDEERPESGGIVESLSYGNDHGNENPGQYEPEEKNPDRGNEAQH